MTPSQLAVVRKMTEALKKISLKCTDFTTKTIASEAYEAAKAEFPDE